MRRTAAILAVVMATWTVAAPAEAKDTSGRVGLGGDTALGWAAVGSTDSLTLFDARVPGVSLVFGISNMFSLQAIAGVSYGKDDASDTGVVIWNTALRAIIAFELSQAVNLGLVFGVGLSGLRINPDPGPHSSGIYGTIEAGLRPEWFVNDNFSLSTQVGFAIAILDDELSAGNDGAIGVDIFGNANLFGNAGFHYWFN